jgi:UDP-glucose:(glucosyl)LPS beta-1,3-glucosyltransferase
MEKINTIKYSVIVPVYNSYSDLKRIIEWFVKAYEKRKDIELVVIDDGSVQEPDYCIDDCGEGLTFYKKKNGGVSSARNEGVNRSRGKYISFLDSDDIFTDDYFNIADEQILNSPELELICFSYRILKPGKNRLLINECMSGCGKDVLSKFFIKNMSIHICSIMILRDVVVSTDIHFDENIKYAEDILYIVSILVAVKHVVITDNVVYQYDMKEGSAITRPMSKSALTYFKSFEGIKILSSRCCDLSVVNFFISTCYINVLRYSIEFGVENSDMIERILEKEKDFMVFGTIPFNKYGAYYLVILTIFYMDRFMNFKLYKAVLRSRLAA